MGLFRRKTVTGPVGPMGPQGDIGKSFTEQYYDYLMKNSNSIPIHNDDHIMESFIHHISSKVVEMLKEEYEDKQLDEVVASMKETQEDTSADTDELEAAFYWNYFTETSFKYAPENNDEIRESISNSIRKLMSLLHKIPNVDNQFAYMTTEWFKKYMAELELLLDIVEESGENKDIKIYKFPSEVGDKTITKYSIHFPVVTTKDYYRSYVLYDVVRNSDNKIDDDLIVQFNLEASLIESIRWMPLDTGKNYMIFTMNDIISVTFLLLAKEGNKCPSIQEGISYLERYNTSLDKSEYIPDIYHRIRVLWDFYL